MEQLNDLIFKAPQVRCAHNNRAEMVCVTKGCGGLPYVCSEKECECTRKEHYNCIHTKWLNLVQRVNSKRVAVGQESKQAFQFIENIYDETIEELSKEREKFVDWRENQGLNPFEREFITYLQNCQESKLTGNLMNSVYFNIDNSEFDEAFKSRQAIRQEWEIGSRHLDSLKKSILEMYQINNRNYFSTKYKDKQEMVLSLLPKKVKSIQLLYNSQLEDFSIQRFKVKCYDHENTLVMMQTKDKYICGFTPHVWNGTDVGGWIKSSSHALKTFTYDFSTKEEYISPTGYQIYRHSKFGPCFGGGTDLVILEKEVCLERLKLPASYETRSHFVFSSKNYSTDKERLLHWEVFQVIWD